MDDRAREVDTSIEHRLAQALRRRRALCRGRPRGEIREQLRRLGLARRVGPERRLVGRSEVSPGKKLFRILDDRGEPLDEHLGRSDGARLLESFRESHWLPHITARYVQPSSLPVSRSAAWISPCSVVMNVRKPHHARLNHGGMRQLAGDRDLGGAGADEPERREHAEIHGALASAPEVAIDLAHRDRELLRDRAERAAHRHRTAGARRRRGFDRSRARRVSPRRARLIATLSSCSISTLPVYGRTLTSRTPATAARRSARRSHAGGSLRSTGVRNRVRVGR